MVNEKDIKEIERIKSSEVVISTVKVLKEKGAKSKMQLVKITGYTRGRVDDALKKMKKRQMVSMVSGAKDGRGMRGISYVISETNDITKEILKEIKSES